MVSIVSSQAYDNSVAPTHLQDSKQDQDVAECRQTSSARLYSSCSTSLVQSPLPKPRACLMDASILIVGSHGFCTEIRALIGPVDRLTIEDAPTPAEALLIVQAQQPDIVIAHGDTDGTADLCGTIKQQSRLAWIHIIVIGQLPESHDVYAIVAKQNQMTSQSLESGADACIWLTMKNEDEIETQFLHAHLQVGLRRVHGYREIVRTNDLLSAIALSDPLTELNNRRAFEWELPRQIHNARERGGAISLLMLDVDFFKIINDTHGHLAGDRALKLISARLRHNLRFYDTPFRYGGEEFVIILNNTGPGEAKRIGQRLCNLISGQPFAVGDDLDLSITVSVGTATLRPEDDEKGISLLRRADQYLLKAKSQGRNQVLSAEEH